MASTATKQIIATRVHQRVVDEVRRIAERASETQSTVVRRLIRFGLDRERQSLAAVAGGNQ